MKKNFIYALLGAIALSGAASLTACSSSDEIVDNPNYNPETNTVKTEFTISLPNNVAGKTRMAATDVQVGGYNDFRGLTDIYLLPFAAATTANSTESVNGSTIKLSDITKDASGAQLDNNKNNSVVYEDISIHTGTSSFIFYAKASGEKASRDQDDKFKLGSLSASGISETMTGVSGVSFALESITTNSAECLGSTKGTNLVTLMNNIASTTDDASPAVKWENAADASLAGLYVTFKSIKAGSSKSIEAALGKLYSSLKSYSDGTGSSKQIADKIRSLISNACSTTPAADATSITLKDDYQGYPADVYLPDGVARINWDATNSKFKGVSTADSDFGKFANPNVYTYPASLYYWTNSSLVAADSKRSTEYGDKSSWEDVVSIAETGVYKGAATSVSASTRSIALVKQIEYAVGRLDTYVKIADGGSGTPVTLKDFDNEMVAIPTGGFMLTGVLVGNQKAVGWNFEPTGSTQNTIYDKDVVSGITASTTTQSSPNYTLVLETAADDVVRVALEFQNGDKEFRGAAGEIIPAGGKFYLLADLKPALSTADPAGNAEDPDKTGNRVFKQDYYTKAIFTIGTNSLKNAYNTLPDLRKPDLELGLSVNLEWRQGITFNVEFQ